MHLSTLLNSQLSNSVGNLNAKLVSALDDELSGLGGDVVGDLSAVLSVIKEKIGHQTSFYFTTSQKANEPVVHQEHLKLLGVVNNELVETVGQKVSGVLVRA